jgi:hypothetical protein
VAGALLLLPVHDLSRSMSQRRCSNRIMIQSTNGSAHKHGGGVGMNVTFCFYSINLPQPCGVSGEPCCQASNRGLHKAAARQSTSKLKESCLHMRVTRHLSSCFWRDTPPQTASRNAMLLCGAISRQDAIRWSRPRLPLPISYTVSVRCICRSR